MTDRHKVARSLESARLRLIDAKVVCVSSDDPFLKALRSYIDTAEGLVGTMRADIQTQPEATK